MGMIWDLSGKEVPLSLLLHRPGEKSVKPTYFHLHLVSDATGETLLTVGRAAAAQYDSTHAIEHVYPLIRTRSQIDRVLLQIEESPGIVLYTLIDEELIQQLESRCQHLGAPCINILQPALDLFQSYLGATANPKVGAQHVLDKSYFQRIDALNYTLAHDDGQLPEDIESADIIILGVSRTSKTPTSIYLANRGFRTTNIPIISNMPFPRHVERAKNPLVVGLIASPDRILQIRQNRLLSLGSHQRDTDYVDRTIIAEEVVFTRKLCARNDWPLIDVTRRSIEETAAAIMKAYQKHRQSHQDALSHGS